MGVAADVRYRELTQTWLTVYFPAAQSFHFAPGYLAIRTAGAPEALLPALHAAIRAVEPQVAFYSSATMEALLARELSRPRTALAVTTLFAVMAIFLAAVGVYGVLSYEIDGAPPRARRAIGGGSEPGPDLPCRGGALPADGRGGGRPRVSCSRWCYVLPRAALVRGASGDPPSFAIGAGLVLAVVLLAALFPARQAAGADPAILLRAQ